MIQGIRIGLWDQLATDFQGLTGTLQPGTLSLKAELFIKKRELVWFYTANKSLPGCSRCLLLKEAEGRNSPPALWSRWSWGSPLRSAMGFLLWPILMKDCHARKELKICGDEPCVTSTVTHWLGAEAKAGLPHSVPPPLQPLLRNSRIPWTRITVRVTQAAGWRNKWGSLS